MGVVWNSIHRMAVVVYTCISNSIDAWTSMWIPGILYEVSKYWILWYRYHLSLRQTNRRKQFVETANNSCSSWNTLQRLYKNVLEVRKMEKLKLITNRLLMRRSGINTTKQS